MASGAIKGITIQFRGDTTSLDKALNKIKSEAKDVNSDLSAVKNALRFNPNNVELLRQKFTLLGQKINSTEEELKTLKAAEAQLKAAGVSKQSEEWMTVRRRIIEAESKLKNFKAQLATVKYANLTALGNQMKNVGQGFRTAGMYATIGGGAMVLAGKKLLELNRTQESAERKLIEVYKTRMGATEDAAKSTMKLASALQRQGVIGDEVTLSGAQMLATYAQMPSTVDKLLPAMTNLLVQSKGYEATAEDATNVAKMFGKVMTGQTGALTKAGITFTAAQQKVLKYGTEEERAAMLAEVVTQNVGNMNSVFAQTDEGKMVQLSNTMSDIGESLGKMLLPALGKVATWLSDSVVPKVEQLVAYLEAHPIFAKIAVAITGLLVVGGPLLIFIGALISAVGTVVGSIGGLVSALGFLISPIGLVIAAITAAIAAGVLLYKNWDVVKARVTAIWTGIKTNVISTVNGIKSGITSRINALRSTITTTFNAIKERITSPFKNAWNTLKSIVNKIRGLFPINFGRILHFSLPRINVSAGKAPWGLGGKGVKPSFGVNWSAHAQGGIFRRPTLLGSATGNHLVGEAGSEAILPLDSLWSHMNQMADSIVNGIGMQNSLAGAGGGSVNITLYAFPNGPQMGQWVVNTYDKYKKQLG